MSGRITRESWEMIADEIMWICQKGGSLTDRYNELEEYLTGEGIIEVMDEE